MSQTLLVCKHLQRSKFRREVYTGKDDILALVESGRFSVDDGSCQQVAGPTEAVCFKAGRTYRREVLEPVELYLFRYRGLGISLPSGKISYRDTERILSTLRLLRLSESPQCLDDFEFKQMLFNDLINQYRLENAAQLQTLAQGDPMILQAMEKIGQNLDKKLRLAELAEESFLSYVQFSRRFKAVTGATPQDYITQLRLKKAKTLLAEAELPVKEIAHSCGFANEYYFSNFFREHLSLSPSQFRAMAKSMEEL